MSEFRSADQRFRTDADGITTFHSFSYGAHYDPDNIAFGPIIAINEECVAGGAGYDTHRHDDVHITTWVIDGALAHEDSAGGSGTVHAGQLRMVSAGDGFTHAERNASTDEPLRFVQVMSAEPVVARLVSGQLDVEGPALVHLDGGDEHRIAAGDRELIVLDRDALLLTF